MKSFFAAGLAKMSTTMTNEYVTTLEEVAARPIFDNNGEQATESLYLINLEKFTTRRFLW